MHHHERWDGNGYPSHLKENEIPLLSRIITIADAFDAITSTRAYRKERSFEEALRILKEEKGKQFDPELVDMFLKIDIDVLTEARSKPDIIAIYKELFK